MPKDCSCERQLWKRTLAANFELEEEHDSCQRASLFFFASDVEEVAFYSLTWVMLIIELAEGSDSTGPSQPVKYPNPRHLGKMKHPVSTTLGCLSLARCC